MKNVRFQDRDSLVTVISEIKNRINITQQEYECTWYSKNEFKNFRNDCVSESKKLHQSGQWHILETSMELLDDDSVPSEDTDMDKSQLLLLLWSMTNFRGLEAWGDPKGKFKKYKIRQRQLSMEVVLEAQRLLWNITRGDEKLRLISKSVTLQGRKFARKMGIADAIVSNNLDHQELTLNHGRTMDRVDSCVQLLQTYGMVKHLGISAVLNQETV
jgi:hypothetical protein